MFKIVLVLVSALTVNAVVQVVPQSTRVQWVETFTPLFSKCVAYSKVDSILAYKSVSETLYSNNDNLKVYFKCVFEGLNMIDAGTGNFLEKELCRQLKGVTPEIAKKCVELYKHDRDIADRAFNLYRCIVQCLAKSTIDVKDH
ncbi:uncharacterized protein LOC116174226 [Photinus pyralis]|uniref:uncharacterized protein LOC116174226 n=1 Tax=Photinus pyralis TaxID=7054 RepID=UPI0012671378|nr:uncharacterized protein LOC116174226 [Photinus pyralis]